MLRMRGVMLILRSPRCEVDIVAPDGHFKAPPGLRSRAALATRAQNPAVSTPRVKPRSAPSHAT